MQASISSLPFDLVDAIASSLDVRSFVSLSRVNWHFYTLLKEDSTARRCALANIPFSREGQLAREPVPKRSYRQALFRTYDHWQAICTASPYSVSILAYATSFFYHQGTLCYSNGQDIRILDTNDNSRVERIISGKAFTNQLCKELESLAGSSDFHPALSVLYYADGVVTVLCEVDCRARFWLFAVDIRELRELPPSEFRSRFLLRHNLQSITKLFVRHNASFLYLGTHSGMGSHGHHEWLIQGFNLTTGIPVSEKPLQLTNFVGSELGSTVSFTIHGDCFYIISNQKSFETEEVDWTSHYHCIRIPLFDPTPDLRPRKIYRRQHREGPINDAWADLLLRVDQRTNDLLIVECRKEWLGGGSTNIRTYYTTKLEHDDRPPDDRISYDPSDPLSLTIDDDDTPSWQPSEDRIHRHKHSEYSEHQQSVDQSFEYLRTKTMFHTYNSAASSFIDLVIDTVAVKGSSRPRELLRLRIGSRILDSPLDPDPAKAGHFLLRNPDRTKDNETIEHSEERFQPNKIQLWPLDDAPPEIFDILCPGGKVGAVQAMADDRSIIYCAGPTQSNLTRERALVMISFDPTWGHKGMKQLHLPVPPMQSGLQQLLPECRIDFPLRPKRKIEADSLPVYDSRLIHLGSVPDWSPSSASSSSPSTPAKRQKIEANTHSLESKTGRGSNVTRSDRTVLEVTSIAITGSPPPTKPRLIWKEEAMYLSINKGVWLR